MNTKLISLLFAAVLGAGIALAETVKGEFESRDTMKNTILLKVGNTDRTFTTNASTKYLDKDGKEQPLLARPELAALWRKGARVTVETGPGNLAKSVQLQLKLMTMNGAPGGKMPETVSASSLGVMKLQGKPLPAFSMLTVGGKALTSTSLKGKVVVLDFWATWCEPCKLLTPGLQGIYNRYKSKGVVVIGADVSEQGDPKTLVSKYIEEHHYSFPMTLNNFAYSNQIGANVLPSVLVVDRAGIVRNVFVGYSKTRGSEIEAAVGRLLAAR